MSSKKTEFEYGSEDFLSDEDFEPRNVKHRITMMLDLDLLKEIKKIAGEKHMGYQTLINQMLRDTVFPESAWAGVSENKSSYVSREEFRELKRTIDGFIHRSSGSVRRSTSIRAKSANIGGRSAKTSGRIGRKKAARKK